MSVNKLDLSIHRSIHAMPDDFSLSPLHLTAGARLHGVTR